MKRPQVVFLIGGQGTRLGTLTNSTPKPLLEVGGKPFLDHLIDNAARFGVRDFVLLGGYLGDQVTTRYRDWGRELGLSIRCIIEPQEAGTGGALRHAQDFLEEEFILFNGDTFFDINLLDLSIIDAGADWIAKMALRQVEDTSRFGEVALAGTRVANFKKGTQPKRGLINGGIYWLRKSIVRYVNTLPCSMEGDILPILASEGKLYGRQYDNYFVDIGIPADLERARSELPVHLNRRAVFFDRDGVLNDDLGYVHLPKDLSWRNRAVETIKFLNDRECFVFVVTNQAGVAHGYYEEAAVQELHDWMQDQLAAHGAHIDAFHYCPHHPSGKRPEYNLACSCRKPAPGLLLDIIQKWPVDRKESFLIGDKDSDIQAAQSAGMPGHLLSGNEDLFALTSRLIG